MVIDGALGSKASHRAVACLLQLNRCKQQQSLKMLPLQFLQAVPIFGADLVVTRLLLHVLDSLFLPPKVLETSQAPVFCRDMRGFWPLKISDHSKEICIRSIISV